MLFSQIIDWVDLFYSIRELFSLNARMFLLGFLSPQKLSERLNQYLNQIHHK